ncbi:hypothetical protein LTR70_009099 [Exophiala xenobiotica]|uniref:Uncharacterized protein n=1 Tax=Lithohypha guttulata TaxID=1690604 RepID=A0ABR0JZ34_9EURO|nr:hypothetical protein LTR24_008791 [Lithohypha guttulata]KAK5310975.1 hypothetical protein LTR70_009099 [Exophiala xenobiotica]
MDNGSTFSRLTEIKSDNFTVASGYKSCRARAAQGMPIDVAASWWYQYLPSKPSLLFTGSVEMPFYAVSQTWNAGLASSYVYEGMSQPEMTSQEALDIPIFAFGALNFTYSNQTGYLEVSGTTCEVGLYVDVYDLKTFNGVLATELRTSHGLKNAVTQLILPSSGQSSAVALYMCFQRNDTQPLNVTALNELGQLDWGPGSEDAWAQEPFAWCKSLASFDRDLLNLTLSGNVSMGWGTDRGDPSSWSLNLTDEDVTLTRWNTINLQTSGIAGDVYLEAGHEHVMNSLSASLTAMTLDPQRNINATTVVTRQMGNVVNLVRVRWRWLTLPYALCLTAVVLLVATISIQRRTQAPLWKCSVNAFFYHGLDSDTGVESRLNTVSEMDAQATVTRVNLRPSGIQQRLMLETTVVRRHVVDD